MVRRRKQTTTSNNNDETTNDKKERLENNKQQEECSNTGGKTKYCSCHPLLLDNNDDVSRCNENFELGEARKRKKRQDSNQQMIKLNGYGIFCLHDINTTWFQGYFISNYDSFDDDIFINRKVKPMGILAVEREMDDCVQCADGGYRELDITILNYSRDTETESDSLVPSFSKPKKITVPTICTGGDMLRIRSMMSRSTTMENNGPSSANTTDKCFSSTLTSSSVKITFDAETVYTGSKTIPFLDMYFTSLVRKQREELLVMQEEEHGNEDNKAKIESMSALDLLPDCAIVRGKMVISGPRALLFPNRQQTDDTF